MSDWDKAISVWNVVPPSDLPGIGCIILQRLFTEHPETQDYFDKLRGIPVGQLGNNADLRKQGEIVLDYLGRILKAKDARGDLVQALATSHINVHKVPVKYFTLVTNIAVKVLTEKFPSQMTAQVQESFSKAFKAICSDLEAHYSAAGFKG